MNGDRAGLLGWFAANPVAANLLMALLLVGGAMSCLSIRQEFIPDININTVEIKLHYPGAAPAEIERLVIGRVEEALVAIGDIKRLDSKAIEEYAIIRAEMGIQAKAETVVVDIKQAIDAITTLPEQLKRPIVKILTYKEGVLWVIVGGRLGEQSLAHLTKQIRDDLLLISDVRLTEIKGIREQELSIEVDDLALLRYDLTIEEFASAIRSQTLDLPLGTVRTASGDILLRAGGEARSVEDFEEMIVKSGSDGALVRVRDLATVRDGFKDTDWFLHFQGERAAGIQVFRVGDQSVTDVAEAVHHYVQKKRASLPAEIHLEVIADTAAPVAERIAMMVINLAFGGMLVFIVLTLFLRLSIAFWVVAGLPVCFLGTLWLMPMEFLDISLNMLSMFGFILVIGIVVDDAIVIGESVHSYTKIHGYNLDNVIAGARQVATTVTFGVLTTVAAFSPILTLPGVNGKLWSNISWVVIFCLLFSLVESKLILPAHLARLQASRPRLAMAWLYYLQGWVDHGQRRFVIRIYRPSLHLALRWRYSVVALLIALTLITGGLLGSGIIRIVFFPEIESDTILIELDMHTGTPFPVTKTMVARIESASKRVNQEFSSMAGSEGDLIRSLVSFPVSENQIKFYAELAPSKERTVSSKDIIARWRKACGPIPGASRLVFSGAEDGGEPALKLELHGKNPDTLADAARHLTTQLATIQGVQDIRNSLQAGKKEMALKINPSVEHLGLTLNAVSNQVRARVHGDKVTTLQRNGDEVEVYVRLPKNQRDSLTDIERMHIASDMAQNHVVADTTKSILSNGYNTIQRTNRRRVLSISADIDTNIAKQTTVVEQLSRHILPELTTMFPGVQYTFRGKQEDQTEIMNAMISNGLLAMLIVYALMAIPLRSYCQPTLIMAAIPFGIIGAVFGHWLLDLPVSILSLCGMIALSGVVVNDSLLLVDCVNRSRYRGVSLIKAVCMAGPKRFRAVFLTSLTTCVSLIPMMLERSLQAQFLIPMAVSLAFGVLFATIITLYLVPALYLIGDDLAHLVKRIAIVVYQDENCPERKRSEI